MGKPDKDPEAEVIQKALDILITSDGKGRERKAKILMELCETVNANKVREAILKMHDDGKIY